MLSLKYINNDTISIDPKLQKIINRTLRDMQEKREVLENSEDYRKSRNHRRCNNCCRYFLKEDTVLVEYDDRRYRLCMKCMKRMGRGRKIKK